MASFHDLMDLCLDHLALRHFNLGHANDHVANRDRPSIRDGCGGREAIADLVL